MKWYFLLALIPYFYYLVFKSRKAMHMLQQNWYNDGNRYFKWILDNLFKTFLIFDALFIGFATIKNNDEVLLVVFSLFYIVAYIIRNRNFRLEQSKKPLVVTARIKRLYVTMILLYLLAVAPMFIYFDKYPLYLYCTYMGLLMFLNVFVVLIANVINRPIEKLVFNHYKRLAKSKLYGMNNLKRIGITGSYGKTSTKNALNDILNVKFNSFATEKSFNTMNGLMISINNKLDKFSDVFIAEMGAFKKGEIKQKCDFIKPKYGILTTVGTAHLESFGSKENIQKAKFELIDSLPSDGIAVLNMDDECQRSYKIKSKCKIVWVSIGNRDADVCASDISLSNRGTKFICTFKGEKNKYVFETKLLGSANVYNVLQAIAMAYNLGMDIEQIQIGVKRIETVEHRLQLRKYGNIDIIDDAYNSNPVGSKMALDVLNMMPGKKIIVTPGMIELGEEQYNLNMEFGTQIARVCDEVILVGKMQTKPILDGLKKEKFNLKKVHILNDVKEAFPLMRKLSDNKTYVLLENDLPDIFNE